MLKKFLMTITFIAMMTTAAEAAENLQEMFAQSSVRGDIRVLDFTRDFDTANTRSDMAVGGLFYFNTAALHGVSFGLAFGTVNDIDSDDDDTVYGILAADEDGDHESFNRLQEYYVQGEWFKTKLKYGAQEINTPFLNADDGRLLPRTYKGLSVISNPIDNLTLSAYYLTDSMGWSDDHFITLSQAVANESGGASSISEDKALLIGGASYTLPVSAVKAVTEAWYYTIADIYNMTYLKANISRDFGAVNVYVIPSVLYQKSQGDELNGELDTNQSGVRAGVKYAGFDVTGYYAKTGDDSILFPWGHDKVIAQQVLGSSRAEEDAWAAKLAYDFSSVGVDGLSAYVWYAKYDVPSSKGNDMDETDYNIQYAFSGVLKGLGVRFRYADINVDGGDSYNDVRYYLTYKFAFQGK